MASCRSIVTRLAAGAAAFSACAVPIIVHGEELANVATHSQRYGAYISISAYDDPLLKGVTCYLSGARAENWGNYSQLDRSAGVTVACRQVGKLRTPARIPAQALVFDESANPIFSAIHVVRILDARRSAVLYFSYTESDVAGDLPGHIDVIRLPADGNRAGQ
ncbi:CreA family protein [Paraburkholderia sp. ZP32-5]|uniref:CreA family protein n=1 Tax=Paraburkholderia sp. ZP32-5 TaxID=2883245 RepID=UPI001F3FBFF8|nr:CreA family protein [Paraburkholderia sp. ZP32-5]